MYLVTTWFVTSWTSNKIIISSSSSRGWFITENYATGMGYLDVDLGKADFGVNIFVTFSFSSLFVTAHRMFRRDGEDRGHCTDDLWCVIDASPYCLLHHAGTDLPRIGDWSGETTEQRGKQNPTRTRTANTALFRSLAAFLHQVCSLHTATHRAHPLVSSRIPQRR